MAKAKTKKLPLLNQNAENISGSYQKRRGKNSNACEDADNFRKAFDNR